MNPSREMVPLLAADVSTFCKNLRLQLAGAGHAAPSHVALLNMLARSAGYRNYQMLRAQPPGVAAAAPAAVEKARGRLACRAVPPCRCPSAACSPALTPRAG